MIMHTTTTGPISSAISASSSTSASSTSSSTTTTSNLEQYHYPPISTLRRPSRPSNIDLSVFDVNNTQQNTDPAIYSAPICHLKQFSNTTNHHHPHLHHHANSQSSFILSPHPHTATFHYPAPVAQQQLQHVQLPTHYHHSQQTHNMHSYQQQVHHPTAQQQQQQQQQQQHHLLDPYSQHQHTPHTFPLQTSSNHYHHYFHFPPSNQNQGTSNTNSTPPAYNPLASSQQQLALQANVTNNGHPSPLNHRPNAVSSSVTNNSQPSTPTHNNRLLAVQMQEQKQQWSNPVLSPLMVKRLNEGNVVASMSIDDDEDPSASIDALVADVDSGSHDLLNDQQSKSINESKTNSTSSLTETRTSNTSPLPNVYLRGTSHILTTPPNPLASTDHPDNQLTVTSNFQKTFSPIHSAGFELTNNANNNVSLSSSNRASFFTFDTHVSEQQGLQTCQNDNSDVTSNDDNHDSIKKTMLINTDERTNGMNQDDNSSHSSSTTSSQNITSRNRSQILHTSTGDRKSSSSSSPSSHDVKISSGSHVQISKSSLGTQNSSNRHCCSHPDCNKIFANKSALAKHKLTHCQDRKHKCVKCNKGFKRLDHLHGHMLTHEEEKPHKCRVPECHRTYCDARSLKRHIENAHQNILAAIHEGGHDEYRNFLPETAYVKPKDISNEFSLDSTESNSPRSSSVDIEPTIHLPAHLRSSNGSKIVPTYTFDEEKSVECQICKKSFKNGAALNGHMRLHGGFNDKQSISLSTDSTQKKKRSTSPNQIDRRSNKRKRPSSIDMNQRTFFQRTIKNEQEDIMINSSTLHYQHQPTSHEQQLYTTLPPCSDVLQHRLYGRTSSRIRSISSSVITPQTSPLMMHSIKNPLSVQPTSTHFSKQHRKIFPFSPHVYDRNNNHRYMADSPIADESLTDSSNNINMSTGLLSLDHLNNSSMFSNFASTHQHEERIRKTLSADETIKYYPTERPNNGFSPSKHSQHYPYFRSHSNHHAHHPHAPNFTQFSAPSPATSSLTPNILHRFLGQSNETLPKEFYTTQTDHHQLPSTSHHSSSNESIRYPVCASPYASHLYRSPSPVTDSFMSTINTPMTSPYSTMTTSRPSPASSVDTYNNLQQHFPSSSSSSSSSSNVNTMQPSPSMTSASPSIAAPKKRILNALKQEAQDEQQQQQNSCEDIARHCDLSENVAIEENKFVPSQSNEHQEQSSSLDNLKIVPHIVSPSMDTSKKCPSAFLITTPSSSSAETNSSTSSNSSHQHFNYEILPATIPTKPTESNSNSLFQWPSQASQFRRQASLNAINQTPNPLPTTPYTPPPMLSPFRKGPGLYYHVFSQATPAPISAVSVTTPFTPTIDEISGPKINIGHEYQAIIPRIKDSFDTGDKDEGDELLFSPFNLPLLDEYALEKSEQLWRTNPFLFTPRQSSSFYPIELVYMLLHEYHGDLQRTLTALLDGTVNDIKECRPLHRYHFLECETWTEEEINVFTKALEALDKNFLLISQAIGTKTVKQCIEFYYMPKLNFNVRTNGSQMNSNALNNKRKRLQIMKTKQQKMIRETLDDGISSSLTNDNRLDEDPNTSESSDHFSCDVDDCLQTFSSERACRAHRHDHRRIKTHQMPSNTVKRSRNIDSNK